MGLQKVFTDMKICNFFRRGELIMIMIFSQAYLNILEFSFHASVSVF